MIQPIIYCLIHSKDSYIFYVGITNNPKSRLMQHRQGWETSNENHLVHKFIRQFNNDIEIYYIQDTNYNTGTIQEAYYISYIQSLGYELANRTGLLTMPFNQLNHSLYNISDEGMKRVEILFLENKAKYIW